MITLIVCATADRLAIGRGGEMLFHLPGDLRRFKRLTSGHTVVMGRKTWESLPKRPLPNRRNVVITRNESYEAPGAEVVRSLEEGLKGCGEEIYVLGGGEIYRQAMPLANRLELTLVDRPTPDDADTFFPAVDPNEWELIARDEDLEMCDVAYLTLARREKNA